VCCFRGRLLTGEAMGQVLQKLSAPERSGGYPMKDLKQGGIDLKQEVEAFERAYIQKAMELTGGNVTKAAQLLGCTRFTLMRRLEENG